MSFAFPKHRLGTLSLLGLLLALSTTQVWADVVELKSGGRLQGKVARDADLPRSVMAIDSNWGRIVVDRHSVAHVTTESPALTEYRRRAPTVPDNVKAQLALALWCRNHGLTEQLHQHLRRVLDQDADHEQARTMLGYQRIDGEWKTRDELLEDRGLIRHEGSFRTRQEVALLNRKKTAEEAQLQWRKTLTHWRRQMDSSNVQTARAGADSLIALKDPAAANQFVRLLKSEKDAGIKLLLIQTAGVLDTRATARALVRLAIRHNDPEIRASCLEQLQRTKVTDIASPFVASLQSKDNAIINRAADAIAVLGNEQSIKPLIESLITTHKHQIGSDSGGDTYSMDMASGQHSFGGGGAKIVKQELRNPRVLQALIALTNNNFLYNQQAWREWLANQQVIAQADLRRDE